MASHGRRVARKAVPKGLLAPRFADGGDISDPMGEAYPPDGGNAVEKFAAGLRDWVTLPGRAMRDGITTEQAVDWAAPTALGMIAGARLPGGAPEGALGSSGAKIVQPEGIRAYHGSPHDFDRFDLSKIGTGEGAQAYGHGLYFAENEGVARSYRDALKWKGTDWNDPQSVASYWVGHFGGDTGKATQYLENSLRQNSQFKNSTGNPEIVGALDILKNGSELTGKPPTPGRMYEVNINAHPDQFLDWDKPLSQQSDAVRGLVTGDAAALRQRLSQVVAEKDALASDRLPSNQMRDEKGWHQLAKESETIQDRLRSVVTEDLPGQLAYYRMAGQKLQSPEASAKLLDQGIPGIKYLDQGSRAAGDGSRNYVVFNDKLIDIVRKYAAAGIALPPAIAAQYEQMKQSQPEHFAGGGLVGNHSMGFGPSSFQFRGAMPQGQQWQGGQGPMQNPMQGGMQRPFGGFNPQQQGGFAPQGMPQGLMGNFGMGHMPMSGFGASQQDFTPQMPQGMPSGAMNQLAANPGTMPMQQPYPGDMQSQPQPQQQLQQPPQQGFSPGTNAMNQLAANPGAQAQPFAAGGMPTHIPLHLRSNARMTNPGTSRLPKGLIASPVAGRTDRINVSAKPNSYVIPADVVSGIGQGNTMAGGRIFDAMLKQGPYGSAGAGAMKGRGSLPKAPKAAPFAQGGLADGATPADEDVPIIVAGGEYHVDPETVAALGGGDPAKGHKILDDMVLKIRQQVIAQLKSLPGPQK